MSIQNLEPQISRLSRAEKAELLQRLAQEVGNTWAGIEKTAGVAGGRSLYRANAYPCMDA